MYYPQSDQRAKANPPAGQELWALVAKQTSQLVCLRTLTTDLIYTVNTRPQTTSRNPIGINALWGDLHVSFSTTKQAFDPKLWTRVTTTPPCRTQVIIPPNSEPSFHCCAPDVGMG